MSEQTTVSACCVTGHIHEGTPLGQFETVHDIRTYVSNPKQASGAGGKKDVAIFFHDIFGPDLVNTKIVADEWAGQGYKVLLPDFFDNDPVPDKHLKAIVPNPRDKEKAGVKEKAESAAVMATTLGPWLVKHREAGKSQSQLPTGERSSRSCLLMEFSVPTQDREVCARRQGRPRDSLLLANDDSPAKVDLAISFHPSFLVEADLKNINSVPCAIFKGSADDMLADDQLDQFEKDLSGRLGDKLHVQKFPGAVHGFAVRGDDMVPAEKKQKEDAHDAALAFTKRWLK